MHTAWAGCDPEDDPASEPVVTETPISVACRKKSDRDRHGTQRSKAMLLRQDPYRELDRWAQQYWGPTTSRPAVMPMDAYRRGDNFYMHFDLPGVDPSSIDLTIEQNTLTVKAERHWTPQESDEVLISERPQGSFSRQVFLGQGLDTDKVHANYERGVLSLEIPVSESVKPRRVEIEVGDERRELASQGGATRGAN
jgi:HSP20 family protein